MARTEVQVSLFAGDKFPLEFAVLEGSEAEGWEPLVLRDSAEQECGVTLTVWHEKTKTKIVTAQAVTLSDADAGLCYYVLSAAETATAGRYVGQLKITNVGSHDAIKRTETFILSIAPTEA